MRRVLLRGGAKVFSRASGGVGRALLAKARPMLVARSNLWCPKQLDGSALWPWVCLMGQNIVTHQLNHHVWTCSALAQTAEPPAPPPQALDDCDHCGCPSCHSPPTLPKSSLCGRTANACGYAAACTEALSALTLSSVGWLCALDTLTLAMTGLRPRAAAHMSIRRV